MLLAIDVGNTNTTIALYDGAGHRGTWRISTDGQRTADEYAMWLTNMLAMNGVRLNEVRRVVLASVVPPATFNLGWLCRKHIGCDPLVVSTKIDLGVEVRITNPQEAGADRLINTLAGFETYGGDLIIIDIGTATTFDIVDEDGAYCGGIIAPGPHPSLEALHRAAAMLPKVDIARPERVVGKGTVAGMQSGIFWGYVSLIEGLVARVKDEMARPMTVIATGGLGVLFAKATPAIDHYDSDLTMRGLLAVARRHWGPSYPFPNHREAHG